jgi:hypothetical protein
MLLSSEEADGGVLGVDGIGMGDDIAEGAIRMSSCARGGASRNDAILVDSRSFEALEILAATFPVLLAPSPLVYRCMSCSRSCVYAIDGKVMLRSCGPFETSYRIRPKADSRG